MVAAGRPAVRRAHRASPVALCPPRPQRWDSERKWSREWWGYVVDMAAGGGNEEKVVAADGATTVRAAARAEPVPFLCVPRSQNPAI